MRSVDVQILQQLLAVHEGIEAVKWLLEERGTLTSRCSSLTSSQYSLGEGPETSWRGSWSSLQDPNEKLDNISVGSYLDTLADDMDEYCPSGSESVVRGPGATVAAAGVGPRPGCGAGSGIRAGSNENETAVGHGMKGKGESGTCKPVIAKSEGPKQDSQNRMKAPETVKGSPVGQDKTRALKANGVDSSPTRLGVNEKLATGQSPKLKPYKNGKIDSDDAPKTNGKVHLEYDAHWRWVQSQEDVTFL